MRRKTKKPVVYRKNPFSYNFIALKESKLDELPVPTAAQLVATPLYNAVGKYLGIDTTRDWNKNYDKIFTITEWAKERIDSSDRDSVVRFIQKAINKTPCVGKNRVDNLHIHIKLGGKNAPKS